MLDRDTDYKHREWLPPIGRRHFGTAGQTCGRETVKLEVSGDPEPGDRHTVVDIGKTDDRRRTETVGTGKSDDRPRGRGSTRKSDDLTCRDS